MFRKLICLPYQVFLDLFLLYLRTGPGIFKSMPNLFNYDLGIPLESTYK